MARMEEIDRRAGAVSDLRAEFEQRKHTALLKKPLVSKGTVVVKGDRTRWDTRTPRKSVMATKGAEIRVYYPADSGGGAGSRDVVEVYNADGELGALAGSPLPRLSVLKARFTIKEIDSAAMISSPSSPNGAGKASEKSGGSQAAKGDEQLIAAELIPIGEELRKHVERVRVLIDGAAPCLRKMEIVNSEGERTEIELKNVKVNGGVTESEVEIRVPTGTKVVHPLEMGKKPEAATDRKPGKK